MQVDDITPAPRPDRAGVAADGEKIRLPFVRLVVSFSVNGSSVGKHGSAHV
jgi:hypothetical protein